MKNTSLFYIGMFLLGLILTVATIKIVDHWPQKTLPIAKPAPKEPVAPKPLFVVEEPQTYAEALTMSQVNNKPLLLMFTSNTCPPCRKMKQTTLQDEGVKALLKDKFVFFMVHDSETADKFHISLVPTFCIVDKDEKVLKEKAGYMDVDKFKSWLTH